MRGRLQSPRECNSCPRDHSPGPSVALGRQNPRRVHQLPRGVAEVWSPSLLPKDSRRGGPAPPQPAPWVWRWRGQREPLQPKNEWPARDPRNTEPQPHPAPPTAAREPAVRVGSAGAASGDQIRDGLDVRRPAPPKTRPQRWGAGGPQSPHGLPGSAEAARTRSSRARSGSTSRRHRRSGHGPGHLRATCRRSVLRARPPPARPPCAPAAPARLAAPRSAPRRHALRAGRSAQRILHPPRRCARSALTLRPPPGRAGGGAGRGARRGRAGAGRGGREAGPGLGLNQEVGWVELGLGHGWPNPGLRGVTGRSLGS